MKESRKIQAFLLRDMIETTHTHIDNFFMDFSSLLELILDRQYFLPVDVRWTELQCTVFQTRSVIRIMEAFGISRKDAEIEVSWFIDRYGFQTT